mmetsp:Transcript_28576/g.27561  ORF Transcript_28576/g.27561 Transcript_28576/m.27561 type:complete len:171 (+) Transcript_28576:1793-2305(+)
MNGKENTVRVMADFPFDSDRKRMSLIVKKNGDYFLLSKGADSIMIPRCLFTTSEDKLLLDKVAKDLHRFACDGLRTLVMGERQLLAKEYEEFEAQYQMLRTSTDPDKDQKLNELFDRMEQGLTFVGASAIEDKLQEGVPEAIAKLIEADIRVWVLTGDKQETAIEIGKSC